MKKEEKKSDFVTFARLCLLKGLIAPSCCMPSLRQHENYHRLWHKPSGRRI